MAGNAEDAVVSVSEKGQATIPKELRDRHGIETPGKVRVRENDDGEIVVEPVAALSDLRGAGSEDAPGTERLRESRAADEERLDEMGRDGEDDA